MKNRLELKNITVGYGAKTIISDINAVANPGKLVAILGKNGAGKSTLIKSILGIINPVHGEIIYNGVTVNHWTSKEKAKLFSIVLPKVAYMPAITVEDMVALGRLPYVSDFQLSNLNKSELIDNALELVQITHLKGQKINQLSDGQLQLVMIARALAQDTPVVIFDEPTSNLDLSNQFKIMDLISDLKHKTDKTFIICTHDWLLTLQSADELWWIENGKMDAGFPEEVALRNSIFDKVSTEKISFDYENGIFKLIHAENNVEITGTGALTFWVKHAINKAELPKPENQIKISVNENDMILVNENKSFDSIASLIEYLKMK